MSYATSKALVLSSRTTKRGRLQTNLPKASRCCSPNDNVLPQSSVAFRPCMGSPSPALRARFGKSTDAKTLSRSWSDQSLPASRLWFLGLVLSPLDGYWYKESPVGSKLGYSSWSRNEPGGHCLYWWLSMYWVRTFAERLQSKPKHKRTHVGLLRQEIDMIGTWTDNLSFSRWPQSGNGTQEAAFPGTWSMSKFR